MYIIRYKPAQVHLRPSPSLACGVAYHDPPAGHSALPGKPCRAMQHHAADHRRANGRRAHLSSVSQQSYSWDLLFRRALSNDADPRRAFSVVSSIISSIPYLAKTRPFRLPKCVIVLIVSMPEYQILKSMSINAFSSERKQRAGVNSEERSGDSLQKTEKYHHDAVYNCRHVSDGLEAPGQDP
ncbi:hypothetical protein BC567DRAFT_72587 [Phyllosticta citribraziliensis]